MIITITTGTRISRKMVIRFGMVIGVFPAAHV
jgi:hypothetical protein